MKHLASIFVLFIFISQASGQINWVSGSKQIHRQQLFSRFTTTGSSNYLISKNPFQNTINSAAPIEANTLGAGFALANNLSNALAFGAGSNILLDSVSKSVVSFSVIHLRQNAQALLQDNSTRLQLIDLTENQSVLRISYAVQLAEKIRVGMTVRGESHLLENYSSAIGGGIDAALAYSLSNAISFGITADHLFGTYLFYDYSYLPSGVNNGSNQVIRSETEGYSPIITPYILYRYSPVEEIQLALSAAIPLFLDGRPEQLNNNTTLGYTFRAGFLVDLFQRYWFGGGMADFADNGSGKTTLDATIGAGFSYRTIQCGYSFSRQINAIFTTEVHQANISYAF